MNEIFNPLTIKIDWGLLFGTISILSLIIGWLIKKINSNRKELRVSDFSKQTLINKPEKLENDIVISINDIDIEQLNKIEFYVQNDGNQTISSDDFHLKPTIDLSGFSNILNVKIYCSNEFTKCKFHPEKPSIVYLDLESFEPKDYLKIEILFDSYKEDFISEFRYRLKEQLDEKTNLSEYPFERSIGIKKDMNAFIPLLGTAILISYGLTWFFVTQILKVNITQPQNFGIGWKIFYATPSMLTAYFSARAMIKSATTHYNGYKRIKNWFEQKKVLNTM